MAEHGGSDGFDPAVYTALGFSAEEARAWWGWRIGPRRAATWRAARVTSPLTAAQWETARVTPATVAGWRAAGIPAAEAIGWHEFGLDLESAIAYRAQGHTPEQAYEVSCGREPRAAGDQEGRSPDAFLDLMSFNASEAQQETDRFIKRASGATGVTMYTYLQAEWVDDEAIAWVRCDIDAATARTWKDLGLRPAEARRFIQRGLSPMAVAREWWRAGIPFEEAASWIGAGLTAREAVEQRERGVTVEQAETLRVLREGDDA
ncbi:hypothetical protein [Actinomadura sp. NEAU-AAG7]|uniref:hypothetical protein n=1 Tax=Actinomadura sp. NEAU-AAG7 TaxID=2839640 RepID=UPI001BE3FB38|nr:hypothetical protein [Actinomadura sp. NEAU-AAG7]MBT2211280.1 hypothetical protein [Actinomadura sp. NEAU-AAG7]